MTFSKLQFANKTLKCPHHPAHVAIKQHLLLKRYPVLNKSLTNFEKGLVSLGLNAKVVCLHSWPYLSYLNSCQHLSR